MHCIASASSLELCRYAVIVQTGALSWLHVHSANRLIAAVAKSLVLVLVQPKTEDPMPSTWATEEEYSSSHKITEVLVARWEPNKDK